MLSQDGILVVVVTLGKDEKKIISGPEIISRGFVYVRESEALIERSTEIVRMIVEQSIKEYSIEWSMLKQNIRELLGQFLYEETKEKTYDFTDYYGSDKKITLMGDLFL